MRCCCHLFIIATFKRISRENDLFSFFGICLVRTQSSLSPPLATVQDARLFGLSLIQLVTLLVCTHQNLICFVQSQFSSTFQRCLITKHLRQYYVLIKINSHYNVERIEMYPKIYHCVFY